jgi:hypothetical protein
MKTKPKKKGSRALKRKPVKPISSFFNIHHNDVKDAIEFAFECDGVKYYRFKDERQIPFGRYMHIDAFLKEHEIRMSLPVLQGYIDALDESLIIRNGEIDLGKAKVIIHKMRTRTNLAFTVDTVERLASVIYFDEHESLKGYDPDHGVKKIKSWKEDKKVPDFFLQSPINELLGLQNTSEIYLLNFIQTQEQILKDLTSTAPTLSEDNSSKKS